MVLLAPSSSLQRNAKTALRFLGLNVSSTVLTSAAKYSVSFSLPPLALMTWGRNTGTNDLLNYCNTDQTNENGKKYYSKQGYKQIVALLHPKFLVSFLGIPLAETIKLWIRGFFSAWKFWRFTPYADSVLHTTQSQVFTENVSRQPTVSIGESIKCRFKHHLSAWKHDHKTSYSYWSVIDWSTVLYSPLLQLLTQHTPVNNHIRKQLSVMLWLHEYGMFKV